MAANLSREERQWTKERVAALVKLYYEGIRPEAIAVQLGRTNQAIRNKLSDLELPVMRLNAWTPTDDARLLELRAQGLSFGKIAEDLHRSESRTLERFKFLRGVATIGKTQPTGVDARVANAGYLISCLRDTGSETIGDLRAYYVARCELDVPPAYDGYRMTLMFQGNAQSYVGSVAAMCEAS